MSGEAELRGLVLARVAALALRHIFDPQQAARLPEMLALLRELGEAGTALRWLQALARYYAEAGDAISEEQLKVIVAAEYHDEGAAVMATIAETWVERCRKQGIEQGSRQGKQEGLQEGLRQGNKRACARASRKACRKGCARASAMACFLASSSPWI